MKFSTKLTLLLLSVVLLLSGSVYYAIHAFTLESMETQITGHIEDMAAHTMDEMDKMLFERQADIQVLTGDSIISSRDSTPEEITQRLVEFRDRYKIYVSLSFFGMDRVRVADTAGMHIGERHQPVPWSEDALDKGIVSAARDVRIAEDQKIPCVYFAAPVGDKTGKALGAVVSRIPMEKLRGIISESFSPYTKMRVKVDFVDREGLLLYSNHDEKGILKEKPWQDMEAWNSFKSGTKKSGSIRHSHPGEGEYLGVFAREQGYLDFAGNGWTLMFHIPTEDAFAPVLRLREKTLTLLSLITGASILLILFLSRSVSISLIRLKDAALRIGKGDLDARIDVRSGDEIGQLAASFNSMAEDLKRSTEVLKRTQFVVDHTSDAFFMIDADARFISVNDAACEMHGYSRDELLSMTVHDLCPDFPTARWTENWKEIKAGRSFSFETRGRTKEGKIISVEVMQNYIEDQGMEYLYVFVRDITERKKMEEALRESEQRFKSLISNIPGAFYQCANDPHWTIEFISSGVEKISGYPPSDFINQVRSWASIIHPDDREMVDKKVQEGVNDRKSYVIEYRVTNVDGEIRWVYEKGQGVFDEQGRFLHLAGAVFDVTNEKILKEQNKMILERTIDGFWVLDLQGRFLEVNDAYCEMSGYSRGELLAMRIPDLEVVESPAETAEHVKKVIKEGGDFFETRHRRKDGKIIEVEVSANFMDIEGGRLFSFIRDVTERKRTVALLASETERLAFSNAELERFNSLAVGREIKMVELKREINALLKELGRGERYKIHGPE